MSGVYGTLENLRNFTYYVPNAEQEKSQLEYQLWGRTTLEYKADCDKPISDALKALDNFKGTYEKSLDFNTKVKIVAISIFGAQAALMILNTVCLSMEKCRKHSCFKVNNFIYGVLSVTPSICMLVLVVKNFKNLTQKYDDLETWSEFGPCVDSLMQVSTT